jgi:hypothetical protein
MVSVVKSIHYDYYYTLKHSKELIESLCDKKSIVINPYPPRADGIALPPRGSYRRVEGIAPAHR